MAMETCAENRNTEGKISWMEIRCDEGMREKGSCKYMKE